MSKHSTNDMSKRSPRGSNTPFQGSNSEMLGSYYTYNPEQQGAVDQFQETTEKLIEVVCSSFKE